MHKQSISESRKLLGMTQRELAEELNLSVRTVEAWESGQRSPSGSARKLIEKLIGERKLPPKKLKSSLLEAEKKGKKMKFVKQSTAMGVNVYRAYYKEFALEMSEDKDHLQIIGEDSKTETFRIIGGQCDQLGGEEVTHEWTDEDWAEVENMIMETK